MDDQPDLYWYGEDIGEIMDALREYYFFTF